MESRTRLSTRTRLSCGVALCLAVMGCTQRVVEEPCVGESSYSADGMGQCAGVRTLYEREGGDLSLQLVGGERFEILDPSLEVLYRSEQPGWEGFITVVREAPGRMVMLVGEDDFIEPDEACGLVPAECDARCQPGQPGAVCRAFTEDFVPLLAPALVGEPFEVSRFQRIRGGSCCVTLEPLVCDAAIDTFTELVVRGPLGELEIVFEDQAIVPRERGWNIELIEPTAQTQPPVEIDLCELKQAVR